MDNQAKKPTAKFSELTKPEKIIASIIFSIFGVFILYTVIAVLSTPPMSEADHMRERIAELQKDIKRQTETLAAIQYEHDKARLNARKALVQGVSNPLGPSDSDRQEYEEGVNGINQSSEMASEVLAQIIKDKAEIKDIQQNLDNGIYSEN